MLLTRASDPPFVDHSTIPRVDITEMNTRAWFSKSICTKHSPQQHFPIRYLRCSSSFLWPSCHQAISKLHCLPSAFSIHTVVIYTVVVYTVVVYTLVIYTAVIYTVVVRMISLCCCVCDVYLFGALFLSFCVYYVAFPKYVTSQLFFTVQCITKLCINVV